jgi:uncharacterized repeat protein (TIGR04076 family)
MSDWYQITAKVINQKGHCEAGHKVGDEYLIGNHTPAGMCVWAFYTLFPFVSALQAGGAFPWEKDKDVTTVVCPDGGNPVTFELKRVR